MAVLLVEDDTLVRLTLAEILEDAGLDVLEAGNAEDALEILRHPAHRIRVLVTDLNLGAGDGGLLLAAKARRHLPNLQVVYATGSPEKFIAHTFSPWEMVFLKPFDPAALAAAVEALNRPLRQQRRTQLRVVETVASSL